MKFSEQISAFVAKTETKASIIFKNSCNRVSKEIVYGTPVSTGRLMGSWSPGINGPKSYSFKGGPSAWNNNLTEKDSAIEAANTAAALSDVEPRIEDTTANLSWKDTYYFTNSTPWAKQAEHEGWLKTGPYNMRENAILQWNSIVTEEIDKLKK